MNWDDIQWEKYRNGTASKDELEKLSRYLEDGDPYELIRLMEQEMEMGTRMPDELADRIRAHMAPKPGRSIRLWAASVAAAAVILLLAGFLYWNQFSGGGNVQQVAVVQFDTIWNNGNTPKRLVLPDSSTVWLNRGARLYINKAFSTQRFVYVQGEVCFDVVKNRQLPFRVQAGNVNTTVLGTVFNVETFKDSSACISLLQGSVKVSHDADSAGVILLPGEMAFAGINNRSISRQKIGVSNAAAWIKGDLVLNQLALQDALDKFGTFYGIKIQADKKIVQDRVVTAVYRGNENWQQALNHLLFIYQLKYTVMKDNSILIH